MHASIPDYTNNYTKSLAIVVPKMMDLQCTHRDVYAAFIKGLFPVRTTDGAWTGMLTDLFIDFVLMAGLKSTGGLSRGRGFNESSRLLFLLSRPIRVEISQSIFEIAGLSSDEEDGHREQTASRIQRDMSDIDKVLQVLLERGVFSTSSRKLVSLSTGLVGDDNVNAYVKTSTGERIEISVSLSWVSVESLLLIYSNTNYALSLRLFLTTSCLCVAETRQNSYIIL